MRQVGVDDLTLGRRGNPYGDAKADRLMKTRKVEAMYPMAFETFDDVILLIRLPAHARKANAA